MWRIFFVVICLPLLGEENSYTWFHDEFNRYTGCKKPDGTEIHIHLGPSGRLAKITSIRDNHMQMESAYYWGSAKHIEKAEDYFHRSSLVRCFNNKDLITYERVNCNSRNAYEVHFYAEKFFDANFARIGRVRSLYRTKTNDSIPTKVYEESEDYTPTYDENGCVSRMETPTGSWYFYYDRLNRLSIASCPPKIWQFGFDPMRRLISIIESDAQVDGNETIYMYVNNDRAIQRDNASDEHTVIAPLHRLNRKVEKYQTDTILGCLYLPTYQTVKKTSYQEARAMIELLEK